MSNVSLLSTTSRVSMPFIKVTIGNYIFGVYDKSQENVNNIYGSYKINKIVYPNYVKRLNIKKVNGSVNKYNLTLVYPITANDDPNFFEKVFSSVSKTRKIVFSYGDYSTPDFCYKDEEAIITKVTSDLNVVSSSITYNVQAVSAGSLLTVGAFTFRERYAQPSDVIKEILYNKTYGLQDIFYGMSDKDLVIQEGLILSDDAKVKIEMKSNISILDYLSYLVSIMTPRSTTKDGTIKNSLYTLTFHDDVSDKFKGPYFKIESSDKLEGMKDAYQIDIGYPTANVVTDFRIENDESFAIYYDYVNKLKPEQYVTRIGDDGNLEKVYAPIISSGTLERVTTESDKSWWTKVTEYPIKVSLTIRGLLKPAILMSHVNINIYFYGNKHIASGLYIVTKEQDTISEQGFTTTLNLVRVGGSKFN